MRIDTIDTPARRRGTEDSRPRILGIGGTTRVGSTSERALRVALDAAEREGAHVDLIPASGLELPAYAPERGSITPQAQALVDLIAAADGLIISTPAFHGGPSGLIKNALDYVEELRTAPRPYLDGRAVAVIVCAAGWQATTTTLVSVRSTIHALRGWPTPLGVAINSARAEGATLDPVEAAVPQLTIAAEQVTSFARFSRASVQHPLTALAA